MFISWQRQDTEITDAEIAQLAEITEAEDKARRDANRKYNERILEDAKKAGLYRKRGADGFRGPSERIKNQKRKKIDPNAPGHHPDTALDVSDSEWRLEKGERRCRHPKD